MLLLCDLLHDLLLNIFSYLSVRDILTLRRVNKRLYHSTKDFTVWAGLLRRLTLALPPAQPVRSNTIVDGTVWSLEYMLSRALRVEHNWRNIIRSPARCYTIDAHHKVLTIRFLPGGNHMVTVCKDIKSTEEYIVVWDMAFQGRCQHVAIAMMHSSTSVLRLQTRYAFVTGQLSLVIAFVRPFAQGKTAVSVVSIPIRRLNELSKLNPGSAVFHEYCSRAPNPFVRLLEKDTRYPVGAISLSERKGVPILAVVHRPRTIIIYNLETGVKCTLKLGPILSFEQHRHSIWEVKLLPTQNHILAIRAVVGATNDAIPFTLELYNIPTGEEEQDLLPVEQRLFLDYNIDAFYLSDSDASWNFRTDTDIHTPMLHQLADCPPPPLSIFFSTTDPRGFMQFLMLPSVDDKGRYRYSCPEHSHAKQEWDEPFSGIVIPGAYRSVVWMRSPGRQPHEGISVERLAIYRTEKYSFSTYGDVSSPQLPGHSTPDSTQENELKYSVIPKELENVMRNGIYCVQFDEYLGRLCVSTAQDTSIRVLDWSV